MEAESASSNGHTCVDMSPETIEQQLDMVSALYELGKYHQTASPAGELINQSGNSREDETTQEWPLA